MRAGSSCLSKILLFLHYLAGQREAVIWLLAFAILLPLIVGIVARVGIFQLAVHDPRRQESYRKRLSRMLSSSDDRGAVEALPSPDPPPKWPNPPA